ncbi:type IA DNA topoisomerase [Coprococcus sp. AM11-30B]|uniref:type IA DNA topoisomerase n=1 Tax=Coprococcus sp. AM11-30B TaxID=2997950 RepID=UPI0022E28547|nr:type IA DNA topoisomerase [Coprococcus sp. AM11-30B]
MSKLVIAEKPMLARDIARAITGKEVSESARLPISGNGYTVCACAGHLLELVEPDAIDPKWGKPWSLDALPVEVHNWPKEPTEDKKSLVEEIAGLLETCDSVIAAGDPDDEGQLIVDELLDYLGYTGKVERVYVNDNIEKNIVKAFDKLVPNDSCRGAGNAAYARQMADMCFGVNETRLATKRLGGLFTVGRVQTPTLGLVVMRDNAIEHHVTRKFYELSARGTSDAGALTFKFKPGKELLAGEKHLFDTDALEALKDKLDGRDLPFETTVSKKQENPPLPYNLTVLLSDMSRRFGFTAAKTQQITQDLRDKYKAITYNRSDSQYLKEEHREQAPAVLSQAMENLGVSWPLDYSLHSKAFNDGNVTAHHGIIPQEAKAPVSKMTTEEAKVYTAICERYAMQFLPPAVYDVSESTADVDGGSLVLTAKRLIDAGFKAVFGNVSDESDGADSDSENPLVPEGSHTLDGISCAIDEKETTPPKPYTEGTLIADMASIAKYVKDPEIREILKRKDDGKKGEHGGIGTTATRSSIIEGLKTRGYLEERKGKVRATDKAKAFYALLPPEIRGADVTARWWLIQQDIADGKVDVNALQDSVIEVFNHHRETAYVGASIAGTGKAVVGKCPKCGKDVVKTGTIYACSSIKNEKQEDGTWKEVSGCGFKLFGFCTKKFTEKQAASLLDGKAVSLRGCKSKAGKTFDCKVVLQKDGSVEPIFTPRKPTKKGRR